LRSLKLHRTHLENRALDPGASSRIEQDAGESGRVGLIRLRRMA
jgi:hypothetical protein